jgi:hypothetical protein
LEGERIDVDHPIVLQLLTIAADRGDERDGGRGSQHRKTDASVHVSTIRLCGTAPIGARLLVFAPGSLLRMIEIGRDECQGQRLLATTYGLPTTARGRTRMRTSPHQRREIQASARRGVGEGDPVPTPGILARRITTANRKGRIGHSSVTSERAERMLVMYRKGCRWMLHCSANCES